MDKWTKTESGWDISMKGRERRYLDLGKSRQA